MFLKSLSVTELNGYVKKVLENDFILKNVLVEGEISNLKIHSSGHAYFSLKDDGGKINCVMFKGSVMYLSFRPENGMKVKVKGRISLYEKEGKYQFYVNEMSQKGEGELFAKYLDLKKRLEFEGLFSESRKKVISEFNKNIGVVTSPTGAALQDFISVAQRRNKGVNIYIAPCLVQGVKAPASIEKGIRQLEKIEEIDVIVITRGGGSLEELWAFNDESLARTIAKCSKPVISAVGHETDYTISDFVSDMRVPTPSAAAELAVFDSSKHIALLNELTMRLDTSVERFIAFKRSDIMLIKERLYRNSPQNILMRRFNELDNYKKELDNRLERRMEKEKSRISKEYALLESYNPLNVLKKGYSIIQDSKGVAVKSSQEILPDEVYQITLHENSTKAKIIKE